MSPFVSGAPAPNHPHQHITHHRQTARQHGHAHQQITRLFCQSMAQLRTVFHRLLPIGKRHHAFAVLPRKHIPAQFIRRIIQRQIRQRIGVQSGDQRHGQIGAQHIGQQQRREHLGRPRHHACKQTYAHSQSHFAARTHPKIRLIEIRCQGLEPTAGKDFIVGRHFRAQFQPLSVPPSAAQHGVYALPQHALYFLPLPHGQASLRPTFSPARNTVCGLFFTACQ